jgi:nucleoside-diphosphate-sugar epimerase
LIRDLTQSDSEVKFLPATQDDPRKRKPDISVAKEQLGWAPVVDVKTGLMKTINYFRMVRVDQASIFLT